jgi:hypothetical protein
MENLLEPPKVQNKVDRKFSIPNFMQDKLMYTIVPGLKLNTIIAPGTYLQHFIFFGPSKLERYTPLG